MSLRLRSLLRSSQLDAELDEELRDHLARQIEENLAAGMSAEAARHAALREFGGLEQRKAECRDARGLGVLERLMQDLRYAVRTLRRAPVFTLFGVGTLALAIGATTATFTLVRSVLLRPLPFPEPERLAMLWERPPRSERRNVAALRNVHAWRERTRNFEALAPYRLLPMNLIGGEEAIQVTGAAVGAQFFRALGVAPLLGRTFVDGEDRPEALPALVLTHGAWQRRFGGRPDVVGRRVSVNVTHHEVVGVMPRGFAFPSGVEMFVALRDPVNDGRNYSTIARLRPGVTLAQAQAELSAIAARTAAERPQLNAEWGASVVPLAEQIVGPARLSLLVSLGAVGFVLLIACANVANLLLVRAGARAREMSLRRALGAGRWRLLHQVLVESLLLAACGGVLGLALARAGLRALVAGLPAAGVLPRLEEVALDPWVFAFSSAVSLGTGLLVGLAPAVQANRVDPARLLHGGARLTATSRRVRGALVVAEVALALPLLAGAALMLRSFGRLSEVELGFRTEGVLTARMLLLPVRDPSLHARFADEVLERIRALPQVIAAGSIGRLPMDGGNSGSWYYRADRPEPLPQERPSGDISIVTPGYFRAMDIPLLQGRDFDARDRRGSPHVAILNRAAALALFPGQDPLGGRLKVAWNDAREVEVVGVAGDIRHSQVQAAPEPCLFLPNAQQPFPFLALVVRSSGDARELAGPVKEAIRATDADQGLGRIETMQQLVTDALARPRLQTALGGLLGLAALLLAVIGIYGVIASSVGQRTRELGVRIALGASRATVFAAVLKDGLQLTAGGLALGLLAAAAVTRSLQRLLFEVDPLDPLAFAAGTGLMLLVAAIACAVPAAHASRVDPAVILRDE